MSDPAAPVPGQDGEPRASQVSDIAELTDRIRAFGAARQWEQFHTAKNLALALTGEVGELAAVLQWIPDSSLKPGTLHDEVRAHLRDEIADVLIYLLRFADVCGIDPLDAANQKIARNESRYPEELARGTAAKYTKLAANERQSESD